METQKAFGTVAEYYDEAFGGKPSLQDVEMFKGFAKRFGGPVLEIGCGTGRVLRPIAEMGIDIDGVDISEPMLSVLRRKIEGTNRRIRIHQGDMRDFALPERYRLVTIPFRVLQHMFTASDKLRALTTAKRHLAPGGRLIFDVAFPRYEALTSGFGTEYLDSEWISASAGNRTVQMHFRRDGYRKLDQVMLGTLIFRTFEGDHVVKEDEEKLEMHFYSLPELEVLFAAAGLEVEESYGSYDLQPLDEAASQMIFVLK